MLFKTYNAAETKQRLQVIYDKFKTVDPDRFNINVWQRAPDAGTTCSTVACVIGHCAAELQPFGLRMRIDSIMGAPVMEPCCDVKLTCDPQDVMTGDTAEEGLLGMQAVAAVLRMHFYAAEWLFSCLGYPCSTSNQLLHQLVLQRLQQVIDNLPDTPGELELPLELTHV